MGNILFRDIYSLWLIFEECRKILLHPQVDTFPIQGSRLRAVALGILNSLRRPYLTWHYTGDTATHFRISWVWRQYVASQTRYKVNISVWGFQLLHKDLWPPSGTNSRVPRVTTQRVRPCPLQSEHDWTYPDKSTERKGLIRILLFLLSPLPPSPHSTPICAWSISADEQLETTNAQIGEQQLKLNLETWLRERSFRPNGLMKVSEEKRWYICALK